MWNEISTSPIFDLQTCNAPQKISQTILITYLKQKMLIFVRKICFGPFLWKNRSFLWRKKILTVIFWWKLQKKIKIKKKIFFGPFLWKKSYFFMEKKNFDGNFLVEIKKKNKKWLYQMKVGMFIGKVKKFGIGWCIPHRMAADNSEGGSGQTPPPHLIGLKFERCSCYSEMSWI